MAVLTQGCRSFVPDNTCVNTGNAQQDSSDQSQGAVIRHGDYIAPARSRITASSPCVTRARPV
jgi:hypothetical protein